MTVLDDIRAQYPGAYDDLSDGQLASLYRKKYYADMPAQDFYRKTGLTHLVGIDEQPGKVTDSGSTLNVGGFDTGIGLSANTSNFVAGAGKAAVDTGRGLAQAALALPALVARNVPDYAKKLLPDALNADSYYQDLKQAQADANQSDAALMGTKAGIAGDIAGNVGIGLLGGGLAKGAGVAGNVLPSGYGGAAAAGGALGAIQPLADNQTELSRLGNAGAGAAGGLLGQLGANVVTGGLRLGRSLLQPITNGGQDQIIANTLQRFGGDAAKNATPSAIPGVTSDLAESTGDAGIAQLRRAVTDSDPAIARQFVEQQAQNNAARLGLLQQVAGTPEDVAAAKAARDTMAQQRYGQAFQDFNSQQLVRDQNVESLLSQAKTDAGGAYWKDDAAKILSEAEAKAGNILAPSAKMQDLAQRPIIQQAAKQAKVIAQNAGVDIGDPFTSLQGQHYIKMALDDAVNTAPQMGIGKAEQSAISSAKREFVAELERQNPAYRQAREAFRDMSAPANRLEVAQGLLDRATGNSADRDILGNPVLRPDAYGRAVDSLDSIAQKVTGQKQAKAANLLNSQQQDAIQGVLGDLSRVKLANNTGKSAGSNTIQNLASQNILNQTAQGLGMPGLADIGILGRVAKIADKTYGLLGVPEELKTKLATVIANPQSAEAQRIIARMKPEERSALAQALANGSGLLGAQAAPVTNQALGR